MPIKKLKRIGFGVMNPDPDEIMRNAVLWVERLRELRHFVLKFPNEFAPIDRQNVVHLIRLCDKEKKYIKVAMEEYDTTPAEQERLIMLFHSYLPEKDVPRVIQLGVPEL